VYKLRNASVVKLGEPFKPPSTKIDDMKKIIYDIRALRVRCDVPPSGLAQILEAAYDILL
jgi:hypothetical protein